MPSLFGAHFSRRELQRHIGRIEQVAGVRLVTLGDGVERGVRLLEFRTGSGFEFDVVVDRAFDIGRCEFRGMALGYQSPVGFAGPWYYEPEGFGWLRNFGGGLLATCGLDHTLFQAEDTATQYFYPGRPVESYGLHGRISNRPARLTGYGERWEGDECVLWAEGEVIQAMALGEALMLRRRIEARVGESSLRIADEVVNVGPYLTPHMLLYHINIGFPFVDGGAEVLVPTATVVPNGDYPVEGWTHLDEPDPTYTERVYMFEPNAEADGIVPMGIVNRRLGLGVYELFRKEQMPFAWVWRQLGDGNYVVGLEPSTNRVAGRLDARPRGELIELEPGDSRSYMLELGILEGTTELDRFTTRMAALAL